LIAHRLRTVVNDHLIQSLDLNFDPARSDVSAALSEAAGRSGQRIQWLLAEDLAPARLKAQEEDFTAAIRRDLETDAWLKTYRGRDILKCFVHQYGGGIRYEPFRDLVIAAMRDAEHQPEGMSHVIDQILADPWRNGNPSGCMAAG